MASIGVVEYYANKSIFITGASGFIGKILIEKLLRSCPEIKAIYLLMRKKKGQSPLERLHELINTKIQAIQRKINVLCYNTPSRINLLTVNARFAPKLEHHQEMLTPQFAITKCFEKIKDTSVFSKLYVIPGDILKEGLGISAQDRTLLQQEIQIVFHSAASVRFDSNLRDAINSNLIGTKHVLEFAEGINNLEVFVYISTSFCHDELEVLEEKIYPPLHRPQDIIDCVKWMNDDMLMKLQPDLIKPYVNTYGYSKNLTEDIVAQFHGKFTIAIARPSVVIASYKEPMPGWVDNINGPTGVVYAGASGILHTSYCKQNTRVDVIPVDIVVNACILLAYTTGIERPKDLRVCNITDFGTTKMTWIDATIQMTEFVVQYPLSRVLYYPAGSATEVYYQHKIAEFFFHTVPAYIIDLLLFLLGHKTFMVRIEKRLRKGTALLQYYTSRTWVFKNDYFRSLKNQITDQENEVFFTDIWTRLNRVDYIEYLKNYHLGVREFIAKEDLSTLPQARRHMKRLYYLHITLKTLFYVLLGYYAFCIFVKYFF